MAEISILIIHLFHSQEDIMNPEKLTIKEIAEMAGVSQTAVSFVINNRPGVSAATREKIHNIMHTTNYVPNTSSRRLMMRRSFNVALLYPSLASPFSDLFYSEIASGLTHCLMESGYNVVMYPLDNEAADKMPNIILRKDADGAIIFQGVNDVLLDKLNEMTFPYVFIDLQDNHEECVHVSLDCEALMEKAVSYLFEMGHRHIGFIGSNQVLHYYHRCFNGYHQALRRRGLSVCSEWLLCVDGSQDAAAAAAKTLYQCDKTPTAVCCTSDMLAVYAMNALRSTGVVLPDSMSFIGVDDIMLSRYVEPALTCVTYDKHRMGILAGELLVGLIDKKPVSSHTISNFDVTSRYSVKNLR